MQVIIKGLRIRSRSSISRLIRHLRNADENERIAFLRGTPADIEDMHRDALARDTAYSVRHWIVAPHETTTRPQMRVVLELLAKEFGFDEKRAVVVERQPPWPVATTILAGGAERKTGMPVWRAVPPA